MSIDAKAVAMLREQTGAGMMDAKRALEEAAGDTQKAAEILRVKGITKAASKTERETKEGRVHAYVHATGKLGVLVEVQCETDFVARTEGFQALCNDLALHVAASAPLYVSRTEVPAEVVEKECALMTAEVEAQGKPAEIVQKIVEGKMEKYFSEICLLEQAFVKDEEKNINDVVAEAVAKLGENIQIRRFARLQIG
ncbi:elongation factor Ts [Candidatus Uhrbacteria bacterium]|nr:elongation factor Ts [Candidatus Uhrbacteria bacterium]